MSDKPTVQVISKNKTDVKLNVSKYHINLDYGSLVVKAKKLNKRSSIRIHSPTGSAGIRG